jgi:hypothetical protein
VPFRPAARLVAVALVALMALLAPAATAGAASPHQWAHSVCGSLDSWVNTVGKASAKVAASKPTSAANVRKKLTKLLALTQRETKSLLSDLRAAGRPDVPGGKQIAATLREGFAQVASSIAGARKTLAKVPTKDPSAFMDGARSVQDALESGLEGVQAAFSAAHSADVAPLLSAFKAERRCRSVAG